MYVTKTRKWTGCNSKSHVTLFDINLVFKLNCFNVAFPLGQRNFSVRKALTNWPNFSFSVTLLNKRSIKLYTTSCDVSWGSAATIFHSTLIFNILCKYTYRPIPFTIYTEQFRSPYGADLCGKAGRQNGIITDGNPGYW